MDKPDSGRDERSDRSRRSSRRAGRKRARSGVTVDGADEEPEGSERGQRTVVGIDARRRRVVLDRGGVVARAGALGTLDVRLEVEAQPEPRGPRARRQRTTVRLGVPQQLLQRRRRLSVAGRCLARAPRPWGRVDRRGGEQPQCDDANNQLQPPQMCTGMHDETISPDLERESRHYFIAGLGTQPYRLVYRTGDPEPFPASLPVRSGRGSLDFRPSAHTSLDDAPLSIRRNASDRWSCVTHNDWRRSKRKRPCASSSDHKCVVGVSRLPGAALVQMRASRRRCANPRGRQ